MHEARGLEVECLCAASLVLPPVPLALIQKPVSCRRHELLRRTAVVGEISFIVARERDARTVVPVVVPDHVQAVPPAIRGPHEPSVLRFVLVHDERLATACCSPD